MPARRSPIPEMSPNTIAVDLPPNYGFCREVFRGVHDHVRTLAGWSLFQVSPESVDYFLNRGEKAHGYVGMIRTAEGAARARRFARYAVNISNLLPLRPEICSVVNDDRESGRIAGRHLRERGYGAIYFWSALGSRYARLRWEGLKEGAGAGARVQHLPPMKRQQLVETLDRLPRPAAVVGETDGMATNLLREIRLLGIAIPADLAVLGFDDDDFLVEAEAVPLSSVRPAGKAIGRKAAELIQLGRARPGLQLAIPPEGVSERMSTDGVAVEDPRIRRVVAALSHDLAKSPDLDRVGQHAGLSRRNMDRLFRITLGVTPSGWLLRRRLDLARRLLITSHLSLESIATQTGFGNPVNLWRTFQREEQMSPGAFRERYRGGPSPTPPGRGKPSEKPESGKRGASAQAPRAGRSY
jgi:LacI family transcriptional regulator